MLEYGKTVDENTAVIEELEIILATLPEKEREDLVNALTELIHASITDEETPTPDSGADGEQTVTPDTKTEGAE